jgi:hypothetical protein
VERTDKVVEIFVATLATAAAVLFSLGASYHNDNLAEAHVLFHWGTLAGSLLVIVFLLAPAYVWAVELRKRRVAGMRGRPAAPRVPGTGRFRRRRAAGNLVIVDAQYGRLDVMEVPVTANVQALVKEGRLKITANHQTLGITDPVEGQVKELEVTYRVGNGKTQTKRFTEGFEVDLP